MFKPGRATGLGLSTVDMIIGKPEQCNFKIIVSFAFWIIIILYCLEHEIIKKNRPNANPYYLGALQGAQIVPWGAPWDLCFYTILYRQASCQACKGITRT